MFINYLKIALRNIKRHKGYSFINIVGLAVGMACCILIFLWVRDELSYDKFHKNVNDIYRVVFADHSTGQTVHSWRTPPPLAPMMKETFPGIEDSTRLHIRESILVKYQDKSLREAAGFADAPVFKIFTFNFVKGNPESAFRNPYSVVITETMAQKYFGSQNPLGKRLTIENQFDLNITGVIKKMPHNTLLQFDFLTPFETIKEFIGEENLQHWGYCGYHTFLLLKKGTNINEFNKKIASFLNKNNPKLKVQLYLQPLTRIHLYSLGGGGAIVYVTIFSLIALSVLLIACINFMNLSTARSTKRAKEIGLRKVVGAKRTHIIRQFFGESILLAIAALLFSLLLVELLLPVFRTLSGKPLTLIKNLSGSLDFLLGLAGIALLTGIISGSYPALYLSSFQPVKVLKGTVKSGSSLFRKGLVVVQYSLAIILIIGTTVIYNQLDYMKNRDPGFNRDNLVCIKMNKDLTGKYVSFRNELMRNPDVLDVTSTSVLVGTGTNLSGIKADWQGKDPEKRVRFHVISVDYDFFETFNMKMALGRSFSREYPTDNKKIILNEEAVRQMEINSPVGKQFTVFGHTGEIIGVVRDFNLEPLHKKVEPMILMFLDDWNSRIIARVKPGSLPATIAYLENTAKKFAPGFPFEYTFLDEAFDRLYRSEQRLGTLFNIFSILAIFIASLGLFGLSSFTAEQRTKEMSIRKTFGASWSNILFLFSKTFAKWVLLANIIAWPAAYLAMDKWLRNFAYRTGMGIEIFFLSALLVLMIAMATVSFQSIKSALVNPVEAFRYE
jgi:ABC-type antimicrobial peptide transport system permease subunit